MTAVPPLPKDWLRAAVAIGILAVIVLLVAFGFNKLPDTFIQRAADFILLVGTAGVLKWLFGRD